MSKKIIFLDGGMGQELQKRSGRPAHPLWSLKVMEENPKLVQAVHEAFIRSGSRILTLNTYPATPARLARDGDASRIKSIQNQAFQLANTARESSGCPHGPVQLAGCLPPLVGSYDSTAVPSPEDCREQYQTIAALQPYVDCFLCETLSTIQEGEVAAEVALATSKPVFVSFTVMDDGSAKLRSGESLEAMVDALGDLPLQGLLLNCSTPEAIRQSLPALQESGIPFGAYANGFESVQALKPGGTVDVLTAREDLTPEAYSQAALEWVSLGATILGGCCEVGPAHISQLHQDLLKSGYEVQGV